MTQPTGRFVDPNLTLVPEAPGTGRVFRGPTPLFAVAWDPDLIGARIAAAETDEQAVFVSAARRAGRLLCSVPNGGQRDARSVVALKREGLSPGFPDLILWDHDGPKVLEFKKSNGGLGDVRPEQLAWLEQLAERGVETWLVFGYKAAKRAVGV